MAILNATLNLKMNRQRGTFEVLSTSTRVYSRDENVSLNVTGWTLDEVTKTSGKTPYEPYFRIVNCDGMVLAECKLNPDATPTPEADNTYAMRGVLSTNTDKMVSAFASGGYQPGWQYDFNALIFATTEANPIATGSLFIWAFDEGGGTAPSNLPTASEVLAALRNDLNSHTANQNNPHAVTAAQVGAYTTGEADGRFAAQTAFTALQNAVASANAAIVALQSAMQTANLAIQSNTVALTGKANANNTYRKDETYSKVQADEQIALHGANRLLVGQTFATPTSDKERNNLLAYIVRSLGGNMAASGITPGTSVSQITMVANDGTSRNLKVVKSGNEYTTEVE